MHYLVYKIMNTVNGKIYIGAHKTKNIDDGYMGSGTLIQRAIKKYRFRELPKGDPVRGGFCRRDVR